jgi:NitT/TauT family transport system substrate-binding protein
LVGGYGRDLTTYLSAIVSFSLLLVGCENNTSQQPLMDSSSMVRVQLQLNWLPDAQHGGFYAAAHSGLYEAEGLEVTIVPGGPGTAVLPKVAMGRCDFAIANADQVLLARAQQADVIAIFAAMQNSPRCIMVHESSGITSLKELANMTLALGDGKAFAEYLKSQIPLTGVRIVSYSGTIAKFMIDDNFAQQGYVFSEPIMAEAIGGDPRALMVSETGFNPYSSVVVTRREIWEQNPDLVRKFVRATRAGWQAYLESPNAANQAIITDNPEMDAEPLFKSAAAIKSLCHPPGRTAG